MSRLKLFRPEGADSPEMVSLDEREPAIFSFQQFVRSNRAGRWGESHRQALERAWQLHRNRRCPHCLHPVVEPVELNDALRSRNNIPIPGTATLVGFRCARCRSEWAS